MIGPTTAMKNSARADGGSCSMLDTPPKRNSVMLRTRRPFRPATSECASSWSRMQPKKSSDARSATLSCCIRGQSGCHPANTIDRFHVRSTKMKSQLQSTRISMPNNLPMRNACMITLPLPANCVVVRLPCDPGLFGFMTFVFRGCRSRGSRQAAPMPTSTFLLASKTRRDPRARPEGRCALAQSPRPVRRSTFGSRRLRATISGQPLTITRTPQLRLCNMRSHSQFAASRVWPILRWGETLAGGTAGRHHRTATGIAYWQYALQASSTLLNCQCSS